MAVAGRDTNGGSQMAGGQPMPHFDEMMKYKFSSYFINSALSHFALKVSALNLPMTIRGR